MRCWMLNNNAQFLFEIGVEELPSGSVKFLAEALQNLVKERLESARITYKTINYFATPRRLALLATEVSEEQLGTKTTRRGPSEAHAYDDNGKPSPALLGFARSCNVNVDELQLLVTDKGSWWVYEAESQSVPTCEVLPKILKEAVSKLPIKKLMRWGAGEIEFVRPVHWILLLWNAEIINTEILGVQAARNTYGHRFHHPQAIVVNHPLDYEQALEKADVIA